MQTNLEIQSLRLGAPSRLMLMQDSSTDSSIVLDALKSKGHAAVLHPFSAPNSLVLRTLLNSLDVLLIDLTNCSYDALSVLERLSVAMGISNVRPRLLCFSSAHRNPRFELAVEKCGARYVRISSLAVLLDAIDLVIAEMDQLQRDGPCFEIIHRYSQGGCAPGEETNAIFLVHGGRFFQVPLSLAQRLLFNFLADHRRIAMDSSQIVSGLAGDWFYRDHAANSGYRQFKKIRRPTVKVLIQRIREALALTFAKAKLRLDPRDVLRSCPAEGSKRVLYKLQAEIRWHHVSGESR